MNRFHLTPESALEALQKEAGIPFAVLMKHGTMQVEYFKPEGADTQQPHRQDELYFIQSGSAQFNRNGEWVAVKQGDVLFVPAGMPHHFTEFSSDFATWVVFYGQQGGEKEQ